MCIRDREISAQHQRNIFIRLPKRQRLRFKCCKGGLPYETLYVCLLYTSRPHERPATASTISKPSGEKMQEIKRPATAPTSKASEPVKTKAVKERPLFSGTSDRKATQSAQLVHRQNVEKVVSQETRQNRCV